MAQRKSVGIWNPYRTTDRADGFQTSFYRDGVSYRCKLYWAPADFTRPDEGGKRAYLVINFGGTMNSFGHYEGELRTAGYVGDVQPRRNYKKLCEIAERATEDKLVAVTKDTQLYHELMLAHGCTYEHGCYYFPAGSDSEEVKRQVNEAVKAIKGKVA